MDILKQFDKNHYSPPSSLHLLNCIPLNLFWTDFTWDLGTDWDEGKG